MSQAEQPTKRMSGSCICGAVTLKFAMRNSEVGACHCGMFRKWSGGIFLAVDGVEDLEITGGDAVVTYRSSDWAERGFCKLCGTSLFWRLHNGDHPVVSAQCVDDFEDPKLVSQIFIDEKPDYYSFAEQTRTMTGAEVFAMFAPKAE
ncbi:MAG: GFA family protein [Pseudomonadota bacterium]